MRYSGVVVRYRTAKGELKEITCSCGAKFWVNPRKKGRKHVHCPVCNAKHWLTQETASQSS